MKPYIKLVLAPRAAALRGSSQKIVSLPPLD